MSLDPVEGVLVNPNPLPTSDSGLFDPAINNHVQATDVFIRGLQSSFVWSETGTVVLSYAFAETAADLTHIQNEANVYNTISPHSGAYNPLSSSTGNDAALKADLRSAMDSYEAVANVDFNLSTDFDGTGVDFQFAGFDGLAFSAGGLNGIATFPRTDAVGSSTTNWEAFIFMNTSSANMTRNGEVGAGSHRAHVSIHEIGHSMGLTHPQDNFDGHAWTTSSNTGAGDHALDNNRYTVMSAERGGLDQNTQSRDHGYATTLMALDVAAVQQIYGSSANHTGNTTYTLTDPETAALDLDGSDGSVSIGRAFYSIWDTGGTDAINYGGSNRALINLNEATLNVNTDPSHVDDWQNDLDGTATYAALSQELKDDLLDEEYHAGGFFSRVFFNDGSAALGGYSIANGQYATAAHNAGAVIENATGGNQNDILIGNEQANVLNGRSGDDYIHGSDGNDTILGGAGADDIHGGDDNDVINGGTGDDDLDGGAGNDTFVIERVFPVLIDAPADPANTNLILTFGPGNDNIDGDGGTDKIQFRGTGTIDMSSTAVQIQSIEEIEFEFVSGQTGTRTLRLSSQEMDSASEFNSALVIDGAAGAVIDLIEIEMDTTSLDISGWTFQQFGTSGGSTSETITIIGDSSNETITGSSEQDIIQGNGGNDTIVGGAGEDTIDGGAGIDNLTGGIGSDILRGGSENDTLTGDVGNDLLDGGTGADDMRGGANNDIYVVDNAGDFVDETLPGSSGFDIVRASVTANLSTNNFRGGIEAITLTGTANINAIGNLLSNVMTGNSGNNVINGLGGGDNMRGLGGNDTYVIDNAGDRVDESLAGSSGTDTILSSITVNMTTNQVLGDVENVRLTGSANINAIGSGVNNLLIGNSGNNVLNGLGGADDMRGFGGNDIYGIDNVGDVVNESLPGSGGFDIINSSITVNMSTAQVSGAVEAVTLIGGGNINAIGNSLNNVLTGNSGNNVLNGLGGADTMRGLGGSDTYVVDNVGDIIDETLAGSSGFDRVLSSVTMNLSNSAQVMGAVERVQLTGSANINGTGNLLANSIVGNSGNNVINGLAGNDSLTGGGGADAFLFTAPIGAGNVDTITDYNTVNDRIWLDDAIFGSLGPTGPIAASEFRQFGTGAQDGNDYLLYNAANGAIFYDADANGAGSAVVFAVVDPGTALNAGDFLIV